MDGRDARNVSARQDRHETRHDMDDQYDLQQEAASAITRDEVEDLTESVDELRVVIQRLSDRMTRQWTAQGRKRRRLAAWMALFALAAAYTFGVAIDHHVHRCMTFGSVESDRTKWWCDVTVPFHDHPRGGISDDALLDVIERAERIREGR